MKASELATRLIDLVEQYDDFEVLVQDITFEADEETGVFDDFPTYDSIEYTELPIEGGIYPCFLLKES